MQSKDFMKITDRIYGTYTINSPVLLELIHSMPLQRLKDISQMGPPDKYYHIKNYSRYEHSIGVMLLLKHLGASEKEQIAGLIHDVSHTAFSHLVDWVVGSGHVENYQDNQHDDFVGKSEIPRTLSKYGYNADEVLDYKNFPLLEQDIPALCADRIDYAMREIPESTAKKCFFDLGVFNNQIVFKSPVVAYRFAHLFLTQQMNHWGGYEAVTRYKLFSDALRFALADGLIKMDDFMGTEKYIVSQIEKSPNEKINKILSALQNKNLSFLEKNNKVHHKKFRHIDPLILIQNNSVTLSSINPQFKKELDIAFIENKKGTKSGIILYNELK